LFFASVGDRACRLKVPRFERLVERFLVLQQRPF
jgi:hypothetical protein